MYYWNTLSTLPFSTGRHCYILCPTERHYYTRVEDIFMYYHYCRSIVLHLQMKSPKANLYQRLNRLHACQYELHGFVFIEIFLLVACDTDILQSFTLFFQRTCTCSAYVAICNVALLYKYIKPINSN